jgi:hypothetical protein
MKITAEAFDTFLAKVGLIPTNTVNYTNATATATTTTTNDLEPRRVASELIIYYQTQQIEHLRDEHNNLVVQGVVLETMLEVLAEKFLDQQGTNQTQRATIGDQQRDIQLQRNMIDRQSAITNGYRKIINKQEQIIEIGKKIINKQEHFIERDQLIINNQEKLIVELCKNRSQTLWKFTGILFLVIGFEKFLLGE